MKPRHFVDCQGMSADEAAAATVEMVNAAQAEWLMAYAVRLIEHGGDIADINAAIERLAVEHVRLREQAIVKMRGMIARGGKGLH